MSKAENKISIYHLVTHTSGMGYESLSEELARYTNLKGESKKGTTGDILGADALYFKVYGFNLPLLFEPGEGWHYGCGMDWAGKIVERTNPERLKLGDYMKKYIFDPLGMKSMTFSLLSPEDIRSRIPKLAVRMEDNGISTLAAVWPEDPPDDCGGVGLYGSAEDFMKLLEMLLQKNGE
ncbi:AmpC Beta-lactamase class C [Pyrenophora tritici-repentis]